MNKDSSNSSEIDKHNIEKNTKNIQKLLEERDNIQKKIKYERDEVQAQLLNELSHERDLRHKLQEFLNKLQTNKSLSFSEQKETEDLLSLIVKEDHYI